MGRESQCAGDVEANTGVRTKPAPVWVGDGEEDNTALGAWNSRSQKEYGHRDQQSSLQQITWHQVNHIRSLDHLQGRMRNQQKIARRK